MNCRVLIACHQSETNSASLALRAEGLFVCKELLSAVHQRTISFQPEFHKFGMEDCAVLNSFFCMRWVGIWKREGACRIDYLKKLSMWFVHVHPLLFWHSDGSHSMYSCNLWRSVLLQIFCGRTEAFLNRIAVPFVRKPSICVKSDNYRKKNVKFIPRCNLFKNIWKWAIGITVWFPFWASHHQWSIGHYSTSCTLMNSEKGS